ncbi:type II/IV secretion system protein [Candidatus Uhrbacteria bacterium]|nr:type II/IV secretion system protein [Candidatus Uhrbacteria bacterium]
MALTDAQLEKLFVDGEFLTKKEFESVKTVAENKHIPVTDAVVELGLLSELQALSLIAEEQGFRFVDLTKERIDPTVLFLIPERVARARNAVAYKKTEDGVWVAMVDTNNYEFIALLQKSFNAPVQVVQTTHAGVGHALKGYQKDLLDQARLLVARMAKKPDEQDVVKLINLLVEAAYRGAASDIHIEPEEDDVVVRFRVHGDLREALRYPKESHDKVVFRIKILSRLRTDEHAQAQDGRFEMKYPDARVNLRVSILPITHGENIVMRLLSEGFSRLRLEDLGLLDDDLEKVKRAAQLPYGMIVVVGPTGSGQTTTLYAMLNILNQPDVNIITVEDPVEYSIRGIRQIQVNPSTNLTFEMGLRSILRQDPDIVMVGEIRDPQTAGIAVNAALTGHLLLTTLHTNDSATAFPRLFDMHVEPFLIASSVNVIIAQRLVRRVCSNCLESYAPGKDLQEALRSDPAMFQLVQRMSGEDKIENLRLYHGKGCSVCHNTGFTGRLGIFEILQVTEELRPLIVDKASSDDIRKQSVAAGMRTMVEDGILKVFKGLTTLEEIIRVTKV